MSKLSSGKKIQTLFIALIAFSAALQAQKDNTCKDIFTKMFSAINNVHTLRYNLYAVERVDNNFTSANSMVKLNVSPFKAYYKDLKKGIEVLWVDGKEDGDAIVNPNGFPYVNLHLSPLGKLMRKGQHQTMLRLGYSYLGNVLSHSLAQHPDIYKNNVHRLSDTVWDNSPCYKIDINFTTYANVPYTVTQPGETVTKIAEQHYLSDYEILTLNNIEWYEDKLTVGQKLQLPAAYAKHVVLYISKESNLPLVIKVYDDKGLFELYEFTNLEVNCTILDSEFTETYPGYHF